MPQALKYTAPQIAAETLLICFFLIAVLIFAGAGQ